MLGLMQRDPLILARILERAVDLHPDGQVVTWGPAGSHRQTYRELGERTARLASSLEHVLGVRPGDRVGTFGWNSHRQLELHFGVPSMGAVLNALNVRLHPQQVARIANRAGSRVVFVDGVLLPRFAEVAGGLQTVERVVVMGDHPEPPALDYEGLLAQGSPDHRFPDLAEDTAAVLCFTSGTTGEPKGVLYSHRALVLLAWMLNLGETYALTRRDVVMPVVNMFHVHGWGLPYAATMAGAKQVFTGEGAADPEVLRALIESEGVTLAAGVPTIWMRLLDYLDAQPGDMSSLQRIYAAGAAAPSSVIGAYRERYGVLLTQAWGLTESGPGASCVPREVFELDPDQQQRLLTKQGRVAPGVRLRLVDPENGRVLPWDGVSLGEIELRGNWVAAGYVEGFEGEPRATDELHEGWLPTGDLAVVHPEGYVELVDRMKDLVRSGGEWISSVQLESALMSHPAVLEAAVVPVPDDTWQERPLAWVVLRPGRGASKEALLSHIAPRFPKFWVPDDVVFVDEIPKTSVGKFDKRALRARPRPAPDGPSP
jgi:fatty-acyl-CoA synthase